MTALASVFQVRVCMLSDWIVGTGEGRVGDVDATVRRDGDGLPFVPAKTLTGIWRDACEQAAGWLGGQDGGWQAWVDWIFGSQPDARGDRAWAARRAPQAAALALSPARSPAAVREACRHRPALRAAAVTLRPGVAIDDETGLARDDMLRLEERARPGVLLALAELAIPGSGDVPLAAELLLRAGAAAVDALGGKRNRGAGRCWLLLPGMTGPLGMTAATAPVPAAARPADPRLAELAAITALLDDPGPPPAHDRPAATLMVPGAGGGGERTIRRVTFEVVTPLVAQHRVLGNVTLSRDSLPGTALLPAILARLDHPVGHRDIVVTDARPAAWTGPAAVPGLPVPMVWQRPKRPADRPPDRADDRPEDRPRSQHSLDVVNAAERRPDPAQRHKPMRTGHIAPAGDQAWHLLTPDMSVSTHAVIDDDAGRPAADRGGVFTYLGIAPGTLLVSDIVLPAGAGLRLAAGDRLRLGRSRKDDFGEVRVRGVEIVTAPPAAALAAGAAVRVWCVSDVLVRDVWGAPDPSPQALAAELTRRLGVAVTVTAQDARGPVAHAHRAARRDSFHTRWGRPRPTLAGMAAGSVVTLSVAGPVPAEILAAVRRDGIGERTAEGFGQVRFDAPEVTVAEPRLAPLAEAARPDGRAGPGVTGRRVTGEQRVTGGPGVTGGPETRQLQAAPGAAEGQR
jgi:CRISPR-associated protein Csx10